MDGLHVNVPITEQSFGRMEVLVGPERRRRWTLAEKRQIIAESLAPGAVSSVVARRHGVHPNQLCDWKRELKRSAVKTVAEFVPISVEAPAPEVAARGQIEILIGMATVRVPNAVDEATLRRVLAALKGAR